MEQSPTFFTTCIVVFVKTQTQRGVPPTYRKAEQ